MLCILLSISIHIHISYPHFTFHWLHNIPWYVGTIMSLINNGTQFSWVFYPLETALKYTSMLIYFSALVKLLFEKIRQD